MDERAPDATRLAPHRQRLDERIVAGLPASDPSIRPPEISPFEARLRSIARAIGIEGTLVALGSRLRRGEPWCRIVMNRDIATTLDDIHGEILDAVEVSGVSHRTRRWRSYASLAYPGFDLCAPPADLAGYDVVLCEQVLEHVRDPRRAAKTLYELTRPGGLVVVSTPFMLRIHDSPGDYWRFSPTGLEILLREAGFEVERVRSWGNAAAVRANFRRWKPYRPWRSLRDDPYLPVVVWAFARRPA